MKANNIRDAFVRAVDVLSSDPSRGRSTAVSKVRLVDGLRCEAEEGDWKTSADLPAGAGGDGSAPTPGILGRAALGSCLAMTYAMWAAYRGIEITSLEIEIQADYDNRGLYGVGDALPGYSEVRYVVRLQSPAPEDDLRALLDEADAHSPYLDVFSRANRIRREIEISA